MTKLSSMAVIMALVFAAMAATTVCAQSIDLALAPAPAPPSLDTGAAVSLPVSGIKRLPWKKLQHFDARSNLFEGEIPLPPPDIKTFLVSNNHLTGEIPELICNITTIEVIDLSNNSFTGTIPECMVEWKGHGGRKE